MVAEGLLRRLIKLNNPPLLIHGAGHKSALTRRMTEFVIFILFSVDFESKIR
jgi:hypothetical protein